MRIAAYCRVSTGNEEQLDSMKNQREFFVKYSKEKCHHLVAIYADEGISGTSLKKRGEFKRMMLDAACGQFDAVVVKDISRFARNTVDFLQGIRELKSYGINTIFVNSNMESFGESEFILTVFSAFAQEESVNISKRVKFGKRISAEKGSVPHSIFGYDRIDNYTLEINPIEAEVIKRIFTFYVDEGLGCRRISAELNKLGDKTKTGGEWSPRGVSRVLKNPIYCGEYVNSKYEVTDCISKKISPLPPEKNICHKRPEWAIVTREYYTMAQDILYRRSRQFAPCEYSARERYSDKYTFSTLIKCEECGRSFTRKTYTYANKRVYWKCPTNDQFTNEKCKNSTTVDEDKLLEVVRETICGKIGDENAFIDEVFESCYATYKAKRNNSNTQNKIDGLIKTKVKYIDQFSAGLIDACELKERLSKVDLKLLEIEKKRDALLSPKELGTKKKEMLKKVTCDFLKFINISNKEMREIVKQIKVSSDGVVTIFTV